MTVAATADEGPLPLASRVAFIFRARKSGPGSTYRADRYDRVSRNPDVIFGDTVEGDLSRRDFTVNAMAV